MSKPSPVLYLPFVKSKGHGQGLSFWAVKSTGDYDRDYEEGRSYAVAYLQWRRFKPFPRISDITSAMARTKAAEGIKWGFLRVIDDAALIAGEHAIAHQIKVKDNEAEYRLAHLLEGVSI